MKNKILALILAFLMVVSISGCGNREFFDTTYAFYYAMIALPDGEILKGKVDSWRDFDDGDQLQVTIDGVTYLTHAANVILMTKTSDIV